MTHKLKAALQGLLETPDLNLDELDPITVTAISKARNALEGAESLQCPVRVYTVTEDTDCGTETFLFFEKAKRDEFVLEWAQRCWDSDDRTKAPRPANVEEAEEWLCSEDGEMARDLDYIQWDDAEIPGIAEMIKTMKDVNRGLSDIKRRMEKGDPDVHLPNDDEWLHDIIARMQGVIGKAKGEKS